MNAATRPIPSNIDLLVKQAHDRGRWRRVTITLLAVLTVGAMVIWNPGGWRGGGGATSGSSGTPLARFSYQGISFSYPARWRAQNKGAALSMESNIVVALSGERLANSCRRLSANSGTCGVELMLGHLPRGGVIVAWTVGGLGGPESLTGDPGRPTIIGGQPAKIDTEELPTTALAGSCPSEATASVTVYTANQYQMFACTNGNNKQFETDVLAMLHSVSFAR